LFITIGQPTIRK